MSRIDCEVHLFHRRFDNNIPSFLAVEETDATGIHESKRLTAPLRFSAHAIARDAGLVMDNRNAPADNAVKQRGFADIRPTHNGNET